MEMLVLLNTCYFAGKDGQTPSAPLVHSVKADNMIIPWQELGTDTLDNLIESFVLREGTDYGEREQNFKQKVEKVRNQLKTGEALIIWSELHETINIMPRTTFGK